VTVAQEENMSASEFLTACNAGDLVKVERLLAEKGVGGCCFARRGHRLPITPLGAAIRGGNIDVVKLLVER
jgi:hypothetical protein